MTAQEANQHSGGTGAASVDICNLREPTDELEAVHLPAAAARPHTKNTGITASVSSALLKSVAVSFGVPDFAGHLLLPLHCGFAREQLALFFTGTFSYRHTGGARIGGRAFTAHHTAATSVRGSSSSLLDLHKLERYGLPSRSLAKLARKNAEPAIASRLLPLHDGTGICQDLLHGSEVIAGDLVTPPFTWQS